MRRGEESRIVSTVSLIARPLSTSGRLRPRAETLGPGAVRAVAAFASFAIAEHVGRVGVLIAAYQRGGGRQAAAVAIALLVPAAILSPLVSRELSVGREVNPLAAGYALQSVALAVAATILALDLQPMLFYTAGVLAAVANVFSRPAHDAFLRGCPSRAGRSRERGVGAAAAVTQRVSGGALVLGPLLSSAVLAQLGVVQVVAVGAALHAVATLLTLGLRTVSPSLGDTPGTADEPMLKPRCTTLLVGLLAAFTVGVGTVGSTDAVVAIALVSVGMQIVLVAATRPECWLIGGTMPYNLLGCTVHDADAHIMETPTWLRDFADPDVRDLIEPLDLSGGNELKQTGDPVEQLADLRATFGRLAERHASDEYRATEQADIMARKNFAATGSFVATDRPRALDLLGFSSQLMFNTFHNRRLHDWEQSGDMGLAYGAARAHNRGMVEFCSVDLRLLPTCYVPLADFDRAAAMAGEAIAMGAAALLVASGCPAGHSPSHRGLDPVWAQAQEADLPVVFHVGGTGDLIDPNYFVNGLPIPPDFHGGEENFRSVDYMAIPFPPMQTLATLVFDGTFDRFPGLRIGVIEQGAIWVPSWMRQMESAFEAFHKHEERLRALRMRPIDYVRRHMKFTPYPTEDVGWLVREAGPEVLLFSSDYPHVEGGRRPIERFERSLGDASAATRQAFYSGNFLDLMGAGARRVTAA